MRKYGCVMRFQTRRERSSGERRIINGWAAERHQHVRETLSRTERRYILRPMVAMVRPVRRRLRENLRKKSFGLITEAERLHRFCQVVDSPS
jgi:hypothetical protein